MDKKLLKYILCLDNDKILKDKEYEVIKDVASDIERFTDKPKYNIASSYDNVNRYNVYKRVNVNDIQILISETDRTANLKDRYKDAMPLEQYIDEKKNEFIELVKRSKIENIKKIEEKQEKLEKELPFFLRFEDNYIYQIFYSEEDKRYFMLFPTKAGEVEVLFYLMKKKIEAKNRKNKKDIKNTIYVPISKKDPSEEFLKSKERKDVINYIWMYTKEWPDVYEYEDLSGDKKLYIIGTTKLEGNLKSKYRIILNNKEEALETFTLIKALFIITTEANFEFEFETNINKKGELIFMYEKKQVDMDNLKDFISLQAHINENFKEELSKLIEEEKKELDELKDIVERQNKVYLEQEKQIEMFMESRHSFFKKLKMYFKSNKQLTEHSEKIIDESRKKEVLVISNSEKITDKLKQSSKEVMDKIEKKELEELILNSYTISDLVKICTETKSVSNKEKDLKQDIISLSTKKNNMMVKIETAKQYLEEIEKHKKNIFEFWKFMGQPNMEQLTAGEIYRNTLTEEAKFILEKDFVDFSEKADKKIRETLSKKEQDSIFVASYLLNAINSVVTKSDTYVLDETYEDLKKSYAESSKENKYLDILGEYTDKNNDKNSKEHREVKKNLYSVLNFDEKTTLDDFKETIREVAKNFDEAYNKTTAVASMPIYYEKKQKGYTLAEIVPYKILNGDKIYKMNVDKTSNILYLSDIIFYNNINKTLPFGMKQSTGVIVKTGSNRKVDEITVNIIIEEDEFNVKIKELKIIEEENAFNN